MKDEIHRAESTSGTKRKRNPKWQPSREYVLLNVVEIRNFMMLGMEMVRCQGPDTLDRLMMCTVPLVCKGDRWGPVATGDASGREWESNAGGGGAAV